MTQKNLFSLAIVVAFLFGVGTMLAFQKGAMGGSMFRADITANSSSSEQAPQCVQHEDCDAGYVCRLGTCAKAERSFCSQSFMLAQSLEDRFIRYTLCPQRCIQSGDSAYCE